VEVKRITLPKNVFWVFCHDVHKNSTQKRTLKRHAWVHAERRAAQAHLQQTFAAPSEERDYFSSFALN
jgi:hypothetical protein